MYVFGTLFDGRETFGVLPPCFVYKKFMIIVRFVYTLNVYVWRGFGRLGQNICRSATVFDYTTEFLSILA